MNNSKIDGLEGRSSEFSKQTVTGKELPGAKLTLTTYTKGKDLSRTVVADNSGGTDFSVKKTSISWTSTDKPAILKGLPDGTYRLHEDGAPAGYSYASDIWFKIVNGVPCDTDGVPISSGSIVMVDRELAEGQSNEAAEEHEENKKKPNSKVKSPQTSESMTILFIVAIALILALTAGAVLLSGRRRSKLPVISGTRHRE